jgi:hypothetical protein
LYPEKRGHFLDECVGGGGAENGQYTVIYCFSQRNWLGGYSPPFRRELLAFTTRKQLSWWAKENPPWGLSWSSFQEMNYVSVTNERLGQAFWGCCALEARLFRGQVVQNEHNDGRASRWEK